MNKKYSRESILEVGIELMRKSGYHATGIKEILVAQSIPKGSFYNYFPSKESFTIECIRHYSQTIKDYWEAIEQSAELNGEQKVSAAFKVLFNDYNEGNFELSDLLGNLSLEMGSTNKEVQREIEEAWIDWKEILRHMIQDAREDGSYSNKLSSSAITNFLFDAFYGTLHRVKIEQNNLPIKQFFSVYIPLVQGKENAGKSIY